MYDDGSDKKLSSEKDLTQNKKISSTRNQIFISYRYDGNGAPGKGFSASFTFGMKLTNYNFLNYRNLVIISPGLNTSLSLI